jgi:hypothetical protein
VGGAAGRMLKDVWMKVVEYIGYINIINHPKWLSMA